MVSSMKTNTYRKDYQYQYNDKDSLIQAQFPRHESFKEIAIFRFNRFLGYVLILSTIASMISYSVVAAKENTLAKIHSKTNDINFENIELQNKVDYARSFYNINNKVAGVNFLKKPDTIMEVKGSNVNPVIVEEKDKAEVKPVSGY
jgi:hypothetical protein